MPPYTVFLFAGLLAVELAGASSPAIEARSHPRDLHKRAEEQCGTWVMQCGGSNDGNGPSIEAICNKYDRPTNSARSDDVLTREAHASSKSTLGLRTRARTWQPSERRVLTMTTIASTLDVMWQGRLSVPRCHSAKSTLPLPVPGSC
jgi:hypothetical protein